MVKNGLWFVEDQWIHCSHIQGGSLLLLSRGVHPRHLHLTLLEYLIFSARLRALEAVAAGAGLGYDR